MVEPCVDNEACFFSDDQSCIRAIGMVNVISITNEGPAMRADLGWFQTIPSTIK